MKEEEEGGRGGGGGGKEGNACRQTPSLLLLKPLDFENLSLPANAASDWLG